MTQPHASLVDLGDISALAQYLAATQNQMLGAYKRALTRTAANIRTEAVNLSKAGIDPKKLNNLRKRLKDYAKRAEGDGLDSLKFWFGLNPVPVSQLKGRVTGKLLTRHTRRDPSTGRYVAGGRVASPTFTPNGGALGTTTFENGYLARSASGKKSIYVRGPYRVSEATLDIHDPMMGDVVDAIMRQIPGWFMKHYESDLRSRVRANIHGN